MVETLGQRQPDAPAPDYELWVMQESSVANILSSGQFRLASMAALVGTTVGLTGLGGSAWAQPQAAGTRITDQFKDEVTLLKDFIHYTNIARYDLAQTMGEQLAEKGLSPRDFSRLVEESQELERFDRAIGRAQKVPAVSETASKLLNIYTKGKLETARDPEQIAANIAMLTGTVRGKLLATERLKTAGEYAVPQLLDGLLNRRDPLLASEAQRVLVVLGPQAVTPLATAMMKLDAASQEKIANVLGLIPYPAALPYLAELAQTTDNQNTKTAAQQALANLRSQLSSSGSGDTADLYAALAERYYAESRDLTSFPGEDFQLLWDFAPNRGLGMTAIRTPVYHEAMALRMAERSLKLKSDNTDALALWVASNFKREIETPQGYANPSYPAEKRDAMYFAVAAGSETGQRVLARAIDTRNTPLGRKAIASIEQTAGGNSLWSSSLSRQPLLEAVTYPNRRVQYEAALALAAAQPQAAFPGSERVIPTLSGAIRDASAKFAAVLAPDNDTYQVVRKMLEKSSYTVLPFARTVEEAMPQIAEAPAVDLIVSANAPAAGVSGTIDQIRGTPKTIATPVMVLTSAEGFFDLRRRYEGDVAVSVRPSATAEDALTKAVDELVLSASGGPISAEEARGYAARSLGVMRDLAVAGNKVLNVEDASLTLISALKETGGDTKLEVAEVLSRINQKRAQVALMDGALDASGAERVALLGKTAASAKRFGNQLEDRQISRLVELAGSGDAAESTAAAALAGALNLPNAQLIPLIVGK